MFKNKWGVIAISVTLLIFYLYLLPLRNQTYFDDWCYIRSVKETIEAGQLRICEGTAASVVFQVAWGVLFSTIFGFSMKITHVSVIFLFAIATYFFYFLLRQLDVGKDRSVFFTILLISFPWTLQLTYTFLSDIPYMSLVIISLFFYIKGLKAGSKWAFFFGGLFSSLSFLTRQMGIVLPASLLMVLVYKSFLKRKIYYSEIVFSMAPFILTFIIYTIYFLKPGVATFGQKLQLSVVKHNLELLYSLPVNLGFLNRITLNHYSTFLEKIPYFFQQLVGFLFPVIFVFSINLKLVIEFVKSNLLVIFTTGILAVFFLVSRFFGGYDLDMHHHYPLDILNYDSFTRIPWLKIWDSWVVLSAVFFLPLLGVSLVKMCKQTMSKKVNPVHLFLFLSVFFSLIFLVVMMSLIDIRYIMSLFPFFIIWFALVSRNWKLDLTRSVIILFLMLIFSIGITKNRYESIGIQWEMGTKLVNAGVAPIDISIPAYTWVDWWYSKNYMEALKNENNGNNGNLDATKDVRPWRNMKSTSKYVYQTVNISLDFNKNNGQYSDIVLDSGQFYSGWFTKRRVLVIKSPN